MAKALPLVGTMRQKVLHRTCGEGHKEGLFQTPRHLMTFQIFRVKLGNNQSAAYQVKGQFNMVLEITETELVLAMFVFQERYQSQ